jgi:hypothetical protein
VWLLGSVAVALVMLIAVWAIAGVSAVRGDLVLDQPPFAAGGPVDVLRVVGRNLLVLALHAMACVAGFIAGSSLPLAADRYSGLWRRIHDHAGPVAIAFVSAATLFSLSTQAYVLGNDAATLSDKLGISPALLLLGLLPHALPELTALFLPLAAWLIASRRGDWHQLLAATFVTVGIAIPTLVTAAIIEVYVSPHLLALLAS